MIPQKTGHRRSGRTILRYLTIAPRLLTAYPIVIRTERERNTQKYMKIEDWAALPFFRLHSKKMIKRNNKTSVSTAAASDKRCFTSDGYGRKIDKLTACGVLMIKLENVGSSFCIGTDELP